MLSVLRRSAKTQVAKVIIGALALAFALWGVNDIFRGAINNVVARVGGTEITLPAYDGELRQEMRRMSLQTQGDITLEQLRTMGMDRIILDRMIARIALDQMATRLGLTVSAEVASAEIRKQAAFFGADGTFNYPQFLQQIQQAGFTEAAYVQRTREDLAREQLTGSTSGGLVPPPGMSRMVYDLINETRTAEYVVLTDADAGNVAAPTDAQLAEYHKAHPDQFSHPEFRSFDHVEISPASVTDKVEVTEDDLQEAYRTQRATFETPEQREIEQITFPDQAAADAAAARLKSGTAFTTVAQERGLSADDIKIGNQTAANMDARLARVAFSTPEGAASVPVQGPFGWVILRVAKVTPATTKTFEEMREPLRATLTRARAVGHMQELSSMFEDERAGGGTLADAAKKLGLQVKTVASVDQMGMTPQGAKAESPASSDFLEHVFIMEDGDESDPFQTMDQNYYVVKLNEVTPAALKPLGEVRDAVTQGYIAQARAEALRKRADELATQAKTSGLAQATSALGRTPVRTMPLKRDANSDVLSPIVLQQIFAVPVGDAVAGPGVQPLTYIVARVADAQHAAPDLTSGEFIGLRRAVGEQMGADMNQTLAAAAREQAGVTIYPEVIQQLFAEPVQ